MCHFAPFSPFAAFAASAALIFRDFRHDGRKFDDLKACQLRIIRAGFGTQLGVTMLTGVWHERDKVVDALRGQQGFEMWRMPALPALSAPLVGLTVGASIGVFFGLAFGGNPKWRFWDSIFGPEDQNAKDD